MMSLGTHLYRIFYEIRWSSVQDISRYTREILLTVTMWKSRRKALLFQKILQEYRMINF